uniref:Uncharacterized protein n=1 Tax=Odontella aurita TaxID=265563 RepID=A0A7S4K049_9STRA|mmetsp:Transcript_58086/g.173354  ORF Transcript_58086/g.173354 Transcript_58086/m.173354 type:complete len:243 (+) Transcript_58086:774-1502(+)
MLNAAVFKIRKKKATFHRIKFGWDENSQIRAKSQAQTQAEEAAATRIQSRWRGWKRRRETLQKDQGGVHSGWIVQFKARYDGEIHSFETRAVVIQCFWRLTCSKEAVLIRRKQKQMEDIIDEKVELLHIQLREFLLVLRIQSCWRCHNARRLLRAARKDMKIRKEEERVEKMNKNARQIQSWFRRIRCRPWFRAADGSIMRQNQGESTASMLGQQQVWTLTTFERPDERPDYFHGGQAHMAW